MSTTNDSEDWLDKQRAELEDAYYCMSGSNETQNEAAERCYEAAWQEIKDRFAHYLKPEDVETRVKSAEDNVIEKAHKPCECGNDHFGTPVRSVTGVVTTYCQFSRVQPSKLNREEKKDAKT